MNCYVHVQCKCMHSAAVESYLLICNAIEQEKSTSSTRKFDTCQTKGCCSRVQFFQNERSEQGLTKASYLFVAQIWKENRGWGARESTA